MSMIEKTTVVRTKDFIDHGITTGETLVITVIDSEGKETNLLRYAVGENKHLQLQAEWNESDVI